MIFIHAIELLDSCVAHKILEEMDGGIPVYRKGTSTNKEGWYLTSKQDLAQELMRDEIGQQMLISALKEKGVEFTPSERYGSETVTTAKIQEPVYEVESEDNQKVNEKEERVEMKMEQYEIITLWATADQDGGYIDISRDKEQAVEWLNRDDDAVQIISGYGVIDKNTNLMPDTASDFHYELETAKAELATFLS